MAACYSSEEDSYLLSVLSEQVKDIVIKESSNKKSKSRYALFYGSDDEELATNEEEDAADEEDWAEMRKMTLQARGRPPVYISNRKAVEEIRRLHAFNEIHGMLFTAESTNLPTPPRSQPPPPSPSPSPPSPSPPPPSRSRSPSPSPLSSLSFQELVRLLDEEVKKLHSSAPCLERQTETLHTQP